LETGKYIAEESIQSMKANFGPPTENEFDIILIVK
jgi:hypothetical protein